MERAVQLFGFDVRPSSSPYIEEVWATSSTATSRPDPSFISAAVSGWEIVVTRQASGSWLTVRGPETRASVAPVPVDAEFFGIRFSPGTFMPGLPLRHLVDGAATFPAIGDTTFRLAGDTWALRGLDDADDFVERLIRKGLLVYDDVVAAALR